MPEMLIRSMDFRDLDEVVKIHQQAFPGFFLTRMGPRFLRAYYQTVLDFKTSIALIAFETKTEHALGFVVGFRDPHGFYALFGQRRRRMLPAIVIAVLRDPALLPQILCNMRRVETQSRQPVDAVELSSIAVGVPGRGVGSTLLQAFADKAQDDGARRLILTTDAENNENVRRFYEAHCFVLDGYEDRGDRRLCRYARSLG